MMIGTSRASRLLAVALLLIQYQSVSVYGRPMVRQIRSAHEFDRLVEKHAKETGLPVIADFYSDGCGPCRQIAPIYQKMAKETGQDNAVFVKINTQAVPELSGRYNVRSIPTFLFFSDGKKVDTMQGADANGLQQRISSLVSRSRQNNVIMTREALGEYYAKVDPSKDAAALDSVYAKCADMNKSSKINPDKLCMSGAAVQLNRRLKQKYKERVETKPRFTAEDRMPSSGSESADKKKEDDSSSSASAGSKGKKADPAKANLHIATKEELMEELENRLEAEAEAREEEMEEEDIFAEFEHSYVQSDFPERVTIIGGGPAGMSAAIYAARAGLTPVVVAPPMGGQLQGKGVDVENYPGLADVTGPQVVSAMREQAATFGAVFECEEVLSIDVSSRPFKVHTNSTEIITHSIIVATGAESNWLDIPGEYEMRGGGVSSCAICDGAAFYGKDVVVVGGGDSAMEEALVLARTSKTVTIIHRRDAFRASKILAQRVIEHPSIHVKWNTVVKKIVGEKILVEVEGEEESDSVDLDNEEMFVTGALLSNTETGEDERIDCAAVFVAIGHTPTTSFLEEIVDFDEEHAGYLQTIGRSTKTSTPGIFAAGDVSDAVYRQAVTSAGSGAAAALDAERWLSEEGLGNEEAEFEAELLAELMADDISNKPADNYNAYDDAGVNVTGMKESARVEF
uniref:Thioredoxin domain-containing protein n=1 Tax=Chaetoceros debilis TaxID=122233 RepID=A0A7S3VCM9_9STRA|mmetsp:Transcript_18712/g.28409  ORF Transcript_18712/g.28409 Transcript_18712/m.28409 type:complete len:684 (+) Transcript_18712:85-2136(+)